jgi:hypothetical protein
MKTRRVLGDVRPGDLGASAPFALHLLVPLLPLPDARQRYERGQVPISVGIACEERGGTPVDVELRPGNRTHRILTRTTILIAVPLGVRAERILEWRHRLDAEARHAAQVGGISNP